jgi:tetratricopeptide (TPR) repeat protein
LGESPQNFIKHLAQQHPLAGEWAGLLASMSALVLPLELFAEHNAGLSEELTRKLADRENRAELVRLLNENGLLDFYEDERPSIGEKALSEIRLGMVEEDAKNWSRAALLWLDDAFPEDPEETRGWDRCEELVGHVVGAVERASELGLCERTAVSLLNRAATYKAARCDFTIARELAERSLVEAEDLEEEDPLVGQAQLIRGSILADLWESDIAKKELENAIVALRTSEGSGSRNLRRARVSLASLLIDLENPKEAEEQLRAAIEEQGEEPDDRPACLAHKLLGWVLSEEDREAAAREYERAMVIAEMLGGKDHPDTSGVLCSYAVLKAQRGDLDEAEESLRRALDIAERAFGVEHLAVAVICSNLSDVLVAFGQPAAARGFLQRSIAIAEAILPAIHRVLWIRHRKLANVSLNLGERQEAYLHAEQALAISEAIYGTNHEHFIADLAMLAAVDAARGDWATARTAYERAISLARRSANLSEREVARYAKSLGRVLRELGDLPGARDRIAEALASFEALEEASADTAGTRVDLADILERITSEAASTSEVLGRTEDAEAIRGHGLATFESVLDEVLSRGGLGTAIAVADAARLRSSELTLKALNRAEELYDEKVHSERLRVASAWHRLGQQHSNKKDVEPAQKAFERTLELLEGHDHFRAMVFHELGNLFYREERYELAAERYKEAVNLRKSLGENSDARALVGSMISLGRCYEAVEQYDKAMATYEERLELLRALPRRDPQAEGVTLHDMADVHLAQGQQEEAVELYSKAAERKREGGESPRDLGVTLTFLGNALEQVKRYPEACDAYAEHLEVLESLEVRDTAAEAIALHNLGNVYWEMAKMKEAAGCYRRAVEIRREIDPGGPKLAHSLFKLGRTAKRLQSLDEARHAYEERLEILSNQAERNPQFEGVTMHDLADVLKSQQRPEEAADLYRTALKRKREAGDGAPKGSLSATLLALASAEHAIGRRRPETKRAAAEALAAFRAEKDPDWYQLASALVLVADAAAASKEPEVAAQAYEEAARLFAEVSEVDLMELASLQFLAGDTYVAAGQEEKAESARAIAKEAFESAMNADLSIGSAVAVTTMGIDCVQLGSLELALRAAEATRARRDQLPDEPRLIHGLAQLLFAIGRAQEAEKDFAAAATSYEERMDLLHLLPKPDPKEEGVTLHDLGDVRSGQGQLEKAAEHYREALERKRALGENLIPDQLAVTLLAIARAELDSDPESQPIKHIEEAIEIYRGEGEELHDPLAASLCMLAECELRGGNAEAALTALGEAEALLSDPKIDEPWKRATLKAVAAEALEALGKNTEAKEAKAQADAYEKESRAKAE